MRITEIDIDDVPWKAELVTRSPVIEHSHIHLSTAPGWGADIDEKVLRAHPWPSPARPRPMCYGMSPEQMTVSPGAQAR